jgi:hypothetical protein
MTPFVFNLFQDNSASPTTRVSATSGPVPNGRRFVVEHISGYFVVGTGDVVDLIWAQETSVGQQLNLPTHFTSRELNFGGALGIARYHQFGSPVKMYINAGGTITLNGDANTAGQIFASVVGYLEPI